MDDIATAPTARALADVRVVDISQRPAGAWTTRLLADTGADVILVEPPDGHPLRRVAPFTDGGESIPAANFLANKRSVTLDLEDERQRERLVALARRSDVLVSSYSPKRLAALGLTCEAIAAPALVMAHLTPHGMTGDLAETPGNDLTVAARSGWAASYCAGAAAYAAIVAALRWRDHHPGEGQEVDVAEMEVMVSTFAPGLLGSQYRGEPLGRRDAAADGLGGPAAVADGHFALTISRAHFWRDAMNVLGLPDLAEDDRYGTSWYRQLHKDEYTARVLEAMRGWEKMALFEELAVRRVVAGPVLTMEELRGVDHLQARGFWRRPADRPDGPEYPGPPYRMSETPASLDRGVPAPGAHTSDVFDSEPLDEVDGALTSEAAR